MRRETIVLAALALAVGSSCSPGPGAAPGPPPPPTVRPQAACGELASVTLTLTPEPGGGAKELCRARAKPERACVFAGGVVRWTVANGCRRLETHPESGKPALAVTRIHDAKTKEPARWDSAACRLALDVVERGTPAKGNTIVCVVPEDAVPPRTSVVFKYDVEGAEVETLDPDIEVRRP